MSVAFSQNAPKPKPPMKQSTIQKMLDENNKFIQTIVDYQGEGKMNEALQYQQLLHRNLVYLATVADSSQNASAGQPGAPVPHSAPNASGMPNQGVPSSVPYSEGPGNYPPMQPQMSQRPAANTPPNSSTPQQIASPASNLTSPQPRQNPSPQMQPPQPPSQQKHPLQPPHLTPQPHSQQQPSSHPQQQPPTHPQQQPPSIPPQQPSSHPQQPPHPQPHPQQPPHPQQAQSQMVMQHGGGQMMMGVPRHIIPQPGMAPRPPQFMGYNQYPGQFYHQGYQQGAPPGYPPSYQGNHEAYGGYMPRQMPGMHMPGYPSHMGPQNPYAPSPHMNPGQPPQQPGMPGQQAMWNSHSNSPTNNMSHMQQQHMQQQQQHMQQAQHIQQQQQHIQQQQHLQQQQSSGGRSSVNSLGGNSSHSGPSTPQASTPGSSSSYQGFLPHNQY